MSSVEQFLYRQQKRMKQESPLMPWYQDEGLVTAGVATDWILKTRSRSLTGAWTRRATVLRATEDIVFFSIPSTARNSCRTANEFTPLAYHRRGNARRDTTDRGGSVQDEDEGAGPATRCWIFHGTRRGYAESGACGGQPGQIDGKS